MHLVWSGTAEWVWEELQVSGGAGGGKEVSSLSLVYRHAPLM